MFPKYPTYVKDCAGIKENRAFLAEIFTQRIDMKKLLKGLGLTSKP